MWYTTDFVGVLVFLSCFRQVLCNIVNDVCDPEDADCQRQYIENKLKYITDGQCCSGPVLVRKHGISVKDCLMECFITSGCKAFNYRIQWKLCQLLDAYNPGTLKDKTCGCSSMDALPTSLHGACSGHDCSRGEKCQTDDENGIKCIPAYCPGQLPSHENASVVEKFGLSRDIKTVFKFECKQHYYLIGKPYLMCNHNAEWEKLFCCVHEGNHHFNKNGHYPLDCNAIPTYCNDGLYTISPKPSVIFTTFCSMRTSYTGKNWHTIQWRRFGRTNFTRNWDDYKNGFGDIYNDLWLGNEKIHILTSIGNTCLLISLKDNNGTKYYIRYGSFKVDGADNNYRLTIGDWKRWSDAGDSFLRLNGMKFSTYDKDNDKADGNCAKAYKGGWWFNSCHQSNLNGLYGSTEMKHGIQWFNITEHKFSLKESRMRIRQC